jgi:hypothetical protein
MLSFQFRAHENPWLSVNETLVGCYHDHDGFLDLPFSQLQPQQGNLPLKSGREETR